MLKMITNEVPVGLEEYYTIAEGGTFRLNVEGVVPISEVEALKSKNKEFRETNISLLKEKEKFQDFATLIGGDLTPEKFNEKVESLVTGRINSLTENMRVNYETKLKDLETNYGRASSKLSELVLDSEVTKVATEHGVLSSALEDVMLRAKNAFVVDNGSLKFKEEKLDAEGNPYSLPAWILEQKQRAPHLFAPSQGTGPARPKSSGGRTPGDQVRGMDRISAAFANKNNGSTKKLN